MEGKNFKYDAFISYRHKPLDKAIAEKLQILLEKYRPPNSNKLAKKRIKRIFRDQSELPTSGDLGEDIRKALRESEYLIVICSKDTNNSKWCLEEIDYFKSLHNGSIDNILTLLVDGDPKEVFPKQLRYEEVKNIKQKYDGETVQVKEVEPLAADISSDGNINISLKKLRTEFLRIAAPMLECGYDDLYKRHVRRKIRTIVLASIASILVFICFFAVVVSGNIRLNNQIEKTKEQQLARTISYASDLADAGDKYLANAILSEVGNYLSTDLESINELLLSYDGALAKSTGYAKFSAVGKYNCGSEVTAVAFSNEDSLFAAGSVDGQIIIASCENGQVLQEFSIPMGASQICFADKVVVIATRLGDVYVWNMELEKLVWEQKDIGDMSYESKYGVDLISDYNLYKNLIKQLVYNEEGNYVFITGEAFDEDLASNAEGFYDVVTKDYSAVIELDKLNQKGYKPLHAQHDNMKASKDGRYATYQIDDNEFVIYDCKKVQLDIFYSGKNESMDGIDYITCEGLLNYNIAIDGVLYIAFWSEDIQKTCVGVYDYINDNHLAYYEFDFNSTRLSFMDCNMVIDECEETFILAWSDSVYYILPKIKSESDFNIDKYKLEPVSGDWMYQDDADCYWLPIDNTDLCIFLYGGGNEQGADIFPINSFNKYKFDNLQISDRPPCALAVSNLSKYILTAAKDGEIVIHSLKPCLVSSFFEIDSNDDNQLIVNNFGNEEKYDLPEYKGCNYSYSMNSIPGMQYLETIAKNSKTEGYEEIELRIDDSGFGYYHFYSEDGEKLIGVDGKDEGIKYKLWDRKTGKVVKELDFIDRLINKEDRRLQHIAVTDDYEHISISTTNSIKVFNLLSGNLVKDIPYTVCFDKFELSNNLKTLIVINNQGKVSYIDVDTLEVKNINSINLKGANIESIKVDFATQRLFISTYSGLDVSTGGEIFNLFTGEKLFSIYENDSVFRDLGDYGWWVSSENCTLIMCDNVFEVPNMWEMNEYVNTVTEGRVLTEQERQNSGLNIFY